MDALYNRITRVGDPEAEIAAMDDDALQDLHAYLAASNVQTGIPCLVRGLLEIEAGKRFLTTEEE
jgi:hypothetical protein